MREGIQFYYLVSVLFQTEPAHNRCLKHVNKQVNKTGNVFKCCLLQEVLPGRPGSICILCMYLLSVYPSRLSALKRQGPSRFIYRDLPGTSPGACHVA